MSTRTALLALLLGLVLVVCGSRASAQEGSDLPETLVAAEEALRSGRADTAVGLYESLLTEHGPQADLYYNLGLAQVARGDLALATLAFERSLALEPGADDAEAQLASAREALQRELLSASTERGLTRGEPRSFVLWRFFHRWPADALSLALLVAWLLLFGALGARRLVVHRALRDVLALTAALGALVALGTAAYLVGRWQTDDLRPAVVIAESPQLYESPIELASTRQPDDLYRGALVRIVETREGWLSVELADGTRGWMVSGTLGEVRLD